MLIFGSPSIMSWCLSRKVVYLRSAPHFPRDVGFGALYTYKLRKQVQLNKLNSEMKYQPVTNARPIIYRNQQLDTLILIKIRSIIYSRIDEYLYNQNTYQSSNG
jgi:hypothetical protein